ncbi:hypothetical protein PsYK624_132110 [Phanerochaete sordida]|uniref:Uncharacterized protein n=1 Tax=Phanerochaete sordida TaxID=48140 RepID=A0A9P3LIY2_9APHY|nr:hypothetical protein PsYK624_132110 [Phanerochaete sordida]
MFRKLVHAFKHALVVIDPEPTPAKGGIDEEEDIEAPPESLDVPASAELPLELWAPIADAVVATYLDELWMTLPSEGTDDTVKQNATPNAVHSLLRVSFNARHATLRSLSQMLGLAYDSTHTGRLSADPQPRIAALRALWTSEPLSALPPAVAALAAHAPTPAAYAHLVSATRHTRAIFALLVADAATDTGIEALRPLQPGMKAATDYVYGAAFLAVPSEVCARLARWRKPVFVLAVSMMKAAVAAHQYLFMCKTTARERHVPLEQAPHSFPENDPRYDRILTILSDCLRGVPPAYDALCMYPHARTLLVRVRETVGHPALAVSSALLADTARVEGPDSRYDAMRTGAARAGDVVGDVMVVGGRLHGI